ncbi:Disease resistance protein CC-NBS-LRR class family [Prunus dulcis]|uniref:Disease resistance protein CC-NBS-LRR class family n=1 Tax=Prunus dulcis TaxID=3755 RepID=A0A4Y1R4J4_PRUDU|nr:Disease resistance protein CC-NBS-LRR class family [Prunus dulcis]
MLKWLVFAPNLIHLHVYGCSKMTTILGLNRTETTPFAKLTVLRLSKLPHLWRICENPLPVPFLKKILISGCPVLTRLPLNSSSAQTSNLIIEGEDEWWNGLEWEDQAARNAFLSCFRPYLNQFSNAKPICIVFQKGQGPCRPKHTSATAYYYRQQIVLTSIGLFKEWQKKE